MLVPSVTTLRIDSNFYFCIKQVSVRPIRLQHTFHTTWFMVEGQVVERRIDVIYSSAPMSVERLSLFLIFFSMMK